MVALGLLLAFLITCGGCCFCCCRLCGRCGAKGHSTAKNTRMSSASSGLSSSCWPSQWSCEWNTILYGYFDNSICLSPVLRQVCQCLIPSPTYTSIVYWKLLVYTALRMRPYWSGNGTVHYFIPPHAVLVLLFGFPGQTRRISDSIRGFENTADSALQDGVNYLNDTINVSERNRSFKWCESCNICIFPAGSSIHCN